MLWSETSFIQFSKVGLPRGIQQPTRKGHQRIRSTKERSRHENDEQIVFSMLEGIKHEEVTQRNNHVMVCKMQSDCGTEVRG